MKKIVLVIDGDSYIGDVIKYGLGYLYPAQYMVIHIKNGEDCFRLLNDSCKPDVILLDVNLSEKSGEDIYDKLKKNDLWKNIPIIFLCKKNLKITEYAGNIFEGFFIEKPFSISDLKKTIDEIFNKNYIKAKGEK